MPQLPTITVVTPCDKLGQHLWPADNAGIVMRVDIDEAGREHHSVSLRDLAADVMGKLPDRTDDAGVDGHIGWLRVAAATSSTRTFRIRVSQRGIGHGKCLFAVCPGHGPYCARAFPSHGFVGRGNFFGLD